MLVFGIPVDFILFALTLLGVALFHRFGDFLFFSALILRLFRAGGEAVMDVLTWATPRIVKKLVRYG